MSFIIPALVVALLFFFYLQALNVSLLQTPTIMGRETEQFPMINNLSLLIDPSTRISYVSDDRVHTFDLILTSITFLYSDIPTLSPFSL